MGQISPDGMWRWNGTQWVPAGQPPPRRSRKWIWWLAGALAISLVFIIAGVGYGTYTLVNRFQGGAFSCLPSDFPQYPGATIISESTNYYGPSMPAGDTKDCFIALISNDPVTAVGPYYQSHFDAGDWIVDSTDYTPGAIHFHRYSRPKTMGTVVLHQRGQGSEIEVVVYS
jgi:hypothetical protein